MDERNEKARHCPTDGHCLIVSSVEYAQRMCGGLDGMQEKARRITLCLKELFAHHLNT
ncbi:hypothetical protein T4E_5152 [Trichinella pseudospiralis]|uniref:Uncharacterized protein n=1 Tax=Trichinella pseudospiralis TaxID=6337 RepID=A0A0V0Y7Z7_TRIPS|nr:hypothetical protein T4E_5152 [Trichinella pseudospiralis]